MIYNSFTVSFSIYFSFYCMYRKIYNKTKILVNKIEYEF